MTALFTSPNLGVLYPPPTGVRVELKLDKLHVFCDNNKKCCSPFLRVSPEIVPP